MKHNLGEGFRLIVNENYSSMTMDFYGQSVEGGRLFIIGFDGEGIIKQEVTKENELATWPTFKPLLKISRFQFEELIKAFVNLADSKNIHTENEDLLQGKLKATEEHLSDMRKMNEKMLDSILHKIR